MTQERKTSDARGSRFGAALFLVIGTVAAAVGLWQCYNALQLVRHGSAAIGTVIADGSGAPVASAHPEIEFSTPQGVRVRYRQNGMGERPVGARIPLLYHPAAPAETATARSFWQLWVPPLVPLWIGVGFIGSILMGAQVHVRGGRY